MIVTLHERHSTATTGSLPSPRRRISAESVNQSYRGKETATGVHHSFVKTPSNLHKRLRAKRAHLEKRRPYRLSKIIRRLMFIIGTCWIVWVFVIFYHHSKLFISDENSHELSKIISSGSEKSIGLKPLNSFEELTKESTLITVGVSQMVDLSSFPFSMAELNPLVCSGKLFYSLTKKSNDIAGISVSSFNRVEADTTETCCSKCVEDNTCDVFFMMKHGCLLSLISEVSLTKDGFSKINEDSPRRKAARKVIIAPEDGDVGLDSFLKDTEDLLFNDLSLSVESDTDSTDDFLKLLESTNDWQIPDAESAGQEQEIDDSDLLFKEDTTANKADAEPGVYTDESSEEEISVDNEEYEEAPDKKENSLDFKEELLSAKINNNLAETSLQDFLPSGDYNRLIKDSFYTEKFKFFYRFRTLKEFNEMQTTMVEHFNARFGAEELEEKESSEFDKIASDSSKLAQISQQFNLRSQRNAVVDTGSVDLSGKRLFLKFKTIGKTGDRKSGKSIKVLQFGNPTRGKHVFLIASLRGCEWAPSLAAVHTALTLIGREGAQKLLQAVRFHVIAVANPDGYEYSRRKSPATAKHWCKNRRLIQVTQSHGVDLAKNFGLPPAVVENAKIPKGGKGKNRKKKRQMTDEEIEAVHNFSEPESQALRDYISHFVTGQGRGALLNIRCCSGEIVPPKIYKPGSHGGVNADTVATLFSKLIPQQGSKYSVVTRDEAFDKKFAGSLIDWAHTEMGIDHAYEINLKATGLATRANHNIISEEPFVQLSRELERATVLVSQLLLAQTVEGKEVTSNFAYSGSPGN